MSVSSADSAGFNFTENEGLDPSVDRLAQRVELLVAASLALAQREQEYRETATRLADDNARLRQVLQHTQFQITQLSQQIRSLEDTGS